MSSSRYASSVRNGIARRRSSSRNSQRPTWASEGLVSSILEATSPPPVAPRTRGRPGVVPGAREACPARRRTRSRVGRTPRFGGATDSWISSNEQDRETAPAARTRFLQPDRARSSRTGPNRSPRPPMNESAATNCRREFCGRRRGGSRPRPSPRSWRLSTELPRACSSPRPGDCGSLFGMQRRSLADAVPKRRGREQENRGTTAPSDSGGPRP